MATTRYHNKENDAAEAKAKAIKKKRRKRKTVAALITVFLITVIVFCILSVTVFFKIESISVTGNTTYTSQEILSAAKIKTGDNLILISGKNTSDRLEVILPFIDGIEVEKTLPGTLKIIVTETKEEICFANEHNCYSANIKGKILKKYDTVVENTIKVTVSNDVKFSTGKNIVFANEREQNLFEDYLNMMKDLNYKVNFINISDPFSSYMKIDDRIVVKFGSSSYYKEKVSYLKASLASISNTAEGVFDLSAWSPDNNQPVLTYGDTSTYQK